MDYKQLIVDSGVRMYSAGLTVETWGNISYCDRETGRVYITPSGMDYCKLTTDDIVVVDLQGNVVEGNRRPSIETGLHVAVYNARPDVNAVIHTHPIFSTVFSSMGEDIPLMHDEGAQALGDVVRTAEYALPGTPELAKKCVKALGQEAYACLLQSHGAVCVSANMDGAFKVAKVLEMMAEIYYRIRATGGKYIPISDENIQTMKVFARTRYGQWEE